MKISKSISLEIIGDRWSNANPCHHRWHFEKNTLKWHLLIAFLLHWKIIYEAFSLPFVLRLVLISLSLDVHFPFGRFQCPIADFPFFHFWIFFSATWQTPFFNPDSLIGFFFDWYNDIYIFSYFSTKQNRYEVFSSSVYSL